MLGLAKERPSFDGIAIASPETLRGLSCPCTGDAVAKASAAAAISFRIANRLFKAFLNRNAGQKIKYIKIPKSVVKDNSFANAKALDN
jgi:hypothetical protein